MLAAAARAADVPLVQISTDYVFDGKKRRPYREDDPVGPLNVYGKSKEEGERMVRSACPQHIILRTSWVFSAYGTNFVRTMLRLAAEREELKIVDDQTGCPTTADDLAGAHPRPYWPRPPSPVLPLGGPITIAAPISSPGTASPS